MEDKDYKTIIESILFTMGESVALTKIAAAIELEQGETKRLIDELAREYIEENRGMRIMELEEAYQMCTSQNTYEYLIKIAKQPKKHVLTEVLLETLSIIAYKQVSYHPLTLP
ncbi:MAG: SMC-Scp complex subunit ScpB, partial [Lachnospiraceae bacterium]|nr:SMC-Scp complex subunit ScpB [Lachnospiraceae bacterium]